MCIFEVLALVMLIGGIVSLITGKVQLTKAKQVTGGKARIIGGVMLLTLPVMFAVAFVTGIVMAASGQSEDAIIGVAGAMSLLAFVVCLVLTLVFILIWAQPVDQQPAPPQQHPPSPHLGTPSQPTQHPPNDPPPGA